MAVSSDVFAGSIPEIYDRLLVPVIFEFYAQDLAGRIAAAQPRDVLETAAGTGVLTRALAARLPERARIVVTDLIQPMIDYARRQSPDGGRTEWLQADALALPFPEASFDAVACQFGVMFFPDQRRGYEEARRVLRLNGRFVFSVWGGIGENDFPHVVTEAVAALFPGDPPRFLARIPYGGVTPPRSRAISIPRASHMFRSRLWTASAKRHPRTTLRSGFARERRSATKLRLATQRVSRRRRREPLKL